MYAHRVYIFIYLIYTPELRIVDCRKVFDVERKHVRFRESSEGAARESRERVKERYGGSVP